MQDHLIALSILCLRSALNVSSVQAGVGLNELSHQSCSPTLCKVECIAILNAHLKRYLDEISGTFSLGEDFPSNHNWSLSGFYSLCIQSIVRKALLRLYVTSTSNNAMKKGNLACREYLHLPVRQFIAMLGSYDPLVGTRPTFSNSPGEDVDRPHPQEYISARLAVRQADWQSRGISGSGDYLKELFEDYRGILESDLIQSQVGISCVHPSLALFCNLTLSSEAHNLELPDPINTDHLACAKRSVRLII